MSASPGSVSARAIKAGSSAPSASVASSASSRPGSCRAARFVRKAVVLSTSDRVASVCNACQRLKGSASCAARNRRSSAERFAETLIGAENPRLIEATGGWSMFANTNVSTGWVRVGEEEGFDGLGQSNDITRDRLAMAELERQLAPIGADKTKGEGDDDRLLLRLAGSRGDALYDLQPISFRAGVVAAAGHDLGGACLRIPEHELREIRARYVGETLHELLDSRGLAVVTAEIQVHALAQVLRAEQHLQHAYDLAACLVNRRRIKIVDLAVERWPHGMCQRTRILDELVGPQAAYVGDPLDRPRALISGELLIAKNGESLLEAELEPVAAGDAVARPIVKIFVRDDRLDAFEIVVGRGFGRGQDVFVVENVEALVLHRAHVEVGDGDDHENIEIVFTAERGFVPAHGTLKRVHGVETATFLARLDIDAQRDLAPGHGAEAVLGASKLSADEREKVRRFRKRIVPHCEMPRRARHIARCDEVAVGEQHWCFGFLGLDAGGVDRHHVGAIRKIGDAAKAFSLTLRAVDRARAVEARQLRVGGR